MQKKQIPIIDLFAGPGGLGEGFMSIVDGNSERLFRIALSIEKDEFAHQTLTLRSFTRQFLYKKIPLEYYQFVRGEIGVEELFGKYPEQAAKASAEAWKLELGKAAPAGASNDVIDRRIRKALNGQNDFVLIGGPPCQAYSLVGRARRQEGEGLNKDDERVYLYREYYRILAEHRPAVFIMENVKGILSSKVEKELLFNQIISDLEDPIEAYKKLKGKEGFYKSRISYKIYSLVMPPQYQPDLFDSKPIYTPGDFVIYSERYGIPQTRHRVILVGVRSDIDEVPELLKEHMELISVEKVLEGLPNLRSGLSKSADGKDEWKQAIYEIEKLNISKTIPEDVWLKMLKEVNKLKAPQKDRGGLFVQSDCSIGYKSDWYIDKKLKGVCNHETRSHIKEDLWRYLFVSCFAKVYKKSPKLFDFPNILLPRHLNTYTNKFNDRFRVQLEGQPSKTVTSHISKDGHYFIHPDPGQCRSLTVREAARIQTFPDNYFFCGPRTQQFHQVGNAVPPLLAKQIAEIVKKIFN